MCMGLIYYTDIPIHLWLSFLTWTEAVYSHQYTGSQEQHTDYSAATNVVTARGVENKVYIERIPYFSLVQRVYDSR